MQNLPLEGTKRNFEKHLYPWKKPDGSHNDNKHGWSKFELINIASRFIISSLYAFSIHIRFKAQLSYLPPIFKSNPLQIFSQRPTQLINSCSSLITYIYHRSFPNSNFRFYLNSQCFLVDPGFPYMVDVSRYRYYFILSDPK